MPRLISAPHSVGELENMVSQLQLLEMCIHSNINLLKEAGICVVNTPHAYSYNRGIKGVMTFSTALQVSSLKAVFDKNQRTKKSKMCR